MSPAGSPAATQSATRLASSSGVLDAAAIVPFAVAPPPRCWTTCVSSWATSHCDGLASANDTDSPRAAPVAPMPPSLCSPVET